MLPAVQEAVAGDRKLAFDYTRADGQKGPRTVEALGLVAKGLTWYLVARGANGIRTYRVSRMAAVTVLASRFERPAQFDLAVYWKESTAKLDEQRRRFEVELCVTTEGARRLREWGATRAAEGGSLGNGGKAPDTHGVPDGWVRLTANFDSEGEALFIVMGLGARARVVSPLEFKHKVAAEATAVAGAAN
jgi:predicted DNA-binding transcriptional regulator YafY